jgi:hypothetical protein
MADATSETRIMNTLHVNITDAEIRKQAAAPVRQLRDHRYPELRFRYSITDRTKGAWHVVVRSKWGKAGNYPGINAKLMQTTLPAILARRSIDPDAASTTTNWTKVGDVLTWYADRMSRDRGLSHQAEGQRPVRFTLSPAATAARTGASQPRSGQPRPPADVADARAFRAVVRAFGLRRAGGGVPASHSLGTAGYQPHG